MSLMDLTCITTSDFRLPRPYPNRPELAQLPSMLRVVEGLSYDTVHHQQEVLNQLPTLNLEQQDAYDKEINAVEQGEGKPFGLNAGG